MEENFITVREKKKKRGNCPHPNILLLCCARQSVGELLASLNLISGGSPSANPLPRINKSQMEDKYEAAATN